MATWWCGTTPKPMDFKRIELSLPQMANVVVREVEMMQAKDSMKRASFNTEQQDVCSSGEWRPPPTPAVAIVDAHDAAWPALVAEDTIEAVRGLHTLRPYNSCVAYFGYLCLATAFKAEGI